MSLIKKKVKKTENVVKELGGFEIVLEKTPQYSYAVIRAKNKMWSVRWRQDSPMYPIVLNSFTDDSAKEYVTAYVTMLYTSSNMIPDKQFLVGWDDVVKKKPVHHDGYYDLLGKFSERELSGVKPVSEEEDAKILSDEKEFHDVVKAMEKEIE